MKKLGLSLLMFFGAVIIVHFVKPDSAHAAVCTVVNNNLTNIFPRDRLGTRESSSCSNADTYMWLSDYHSGSPLQTPTAKLRVFFLWSDVASLPDPIDTLMLVSDNARMRCGFMMNFTYLPTGGSHFIEKRSTDGGATCPYIADGFNLVHTGNSSSGPLASFAVNKSHLSSDTTRYGSNVRYVDVDLTVTTTDTNAPFRLLAAAAGSRARISFREMSLADAQSSSNGASGAAFALWTDDMSGGTLQEPITYTLNFAPDCSIQAGGTVDVYFKWYDADDDDAAGGTNSQHPFRMYIVDDTTGAHLTPSGGLRSDAYVFGNDDQYAVYGPVTLTGGHKYRWIWSDISRNNGVQIYMPFSEMNNDPATVCPPSNNPPTLTLTGACALSSSGFPVISGNVSAGDDKAGYTISGNAGTGRNISTNGNYSFNGTFGETGTVSVTVTDSDGVAVNRTADFTCPGNSRPTGVLTANCDDSTGVVTVTLTVADSQTNTITVSGSITTAQNSSGSSLTVSGSLDVTAGAAQASVTNLTIGSDSTAPITFNGIRNGTSVSISVTLTDANGLTASPAPSTTYSCDFPPPAFSGPTCNLGTILGEPGFTYYPRMDIRLTSYYEDTTVNVSIDQTVDGVAFRRTGSTVLVNTTDTHRFVDSGASDPGAVRVNFDGTNNGIVINTPGNYTINFNWEYTTATYSTATTATCSVVVRVQAKPYFKVWGGDIINYNASSAIKGWNQASPPAYGAAPACIDQSSGKCGASVGGAIIAAGTVDRVKSGWGLSGIKPITFANTTAGWGGGFGALIPPATFTTIGAPTLTSPWAGNVGVTGSATYNVSGNLQIDGNVIYVNADSGYATKAAIPHLRIIVAGNIYISPGVTRLDGEYIATGDIYTCDIRGTASADIYDKCRAQPLIVNGSLVGRSVKLTRTNGTLRNATEGDMTPGTTTNSANVAETIYFRPEVYLTPRPTTADLSGVIRYDAITALPPRF